MKISIKRDEQEYGPYPATVVVQYLDRGSLLPHDLARLDTGGGQWKPLSQLLREQGIDNPVDADAYRPKKILLDLRSFDPRLIFPLHQIRAGHWMQDRRLLLFIGAGMLPIVFVAVPLPVMIVYIAIAFYSSCIWALFFYFLFKTRQVRPRTAVACFFITGMGSIAVLLLIQQFPPWTFLYAMTDSRNLFTRFMGMFFGVGIAEETCKAAVVWYLSSRAGRVLLPQTVVFYGMISGLGFGIYEGVGYQLTVNREQGADVGYILNVLRLTSLPFLHAVWTGISAYFLSFAMVAPKKRISLRLIAILIPAAFHGLYNTLGANLLGVGVTLLSVLFLISYLSNCEELKLNLRRDSHS